ncbi:MAG: phosphoglycolate phosphatase [Robiginitomaculum sp.]|nr:MAG: phosphoglycolate phosphatase [Robiginitomaculum sp.]
MNSALNTLSISFDLDGTLVDTAPDLIRVLNLVIKDDNLPEVPVESARQLIGYGAMALIKKAYETANILLDDDKAEILQKKFFQLYTDDISSLSTPYFGVEEVLAQLKRKGAKLSVCTNKPGDMARSLLEQLDLAKFFDRIIGFDDTKSPKPAAQHIFDAIGHRAATPTIMIGDGAPDVYAAKAAKIPIILMSYGYSPVSVHTFGADRVLRSFRELPSALNEIMENRF